MNQHVIDNVIHGMYFELHAVYCDHCTMCVLYCAIPHNVLRTTIMHLCLVACTSRTHATQHMHTCHAYVMVNPRVFEFTDGSASLSKQTLRMDYSIPIGCR